MAVIIYLLLIINLKCIFTQDYVKKPNGENWPGNLEKRSNLGNWLINGNWDPEHKVTPNTKEYEYPGYDGWYNNIARPDSGAIDGPLLRRVPNAYKDGVYYPSGEDRPNPFELSDQLLNAHHVKQKSFDGRNAFLVFFGQQVVEEILDAQRPACPPEYFNISIPKEHKYRKIYKHTAMPFLRTRYNQNTGFSPNNPRQQINEITPYLDGGLFYGITKQWSDQLRTDENGIIDENGELASSEDGLFPAYNTARLPMANPPPPFYHGHYIKNHETDKVSRFFKLGNPRGNENAFLLTFGVLWFRWHNYLAKTIKRHHRDWSSEKVFNEARKWTIATQQQIVVYEWLPSWISGGLGRYPGYDPSVDPQIDQFFQTTAFRFGHTLVVPGVYLRDYTKYGCKTKFKNWDKKAVRTCNIFWRPQEPLLAKDDNNTAFIDIDRLIMGMTSQLSEAEDHRIVEDLRGNVFGPLEFPRRDLMAINVQRARDHGMPDYNTARQAYGLEPNSFDDLAKIVQNATIISALKSLYKNDINNIDPWIGGILETTKNGPGQLFRTVILDQFNRIRNADRFWFENYKMNKLFTKEEFQRIKQLRIYDVVMAVTKMEGHDIPKNPFRAPIKPDDEILIGMCKLKSSSNVNNKINNATTKQYYHLEHLTLDNLMETCTEGTSYDYFSNSEASFIVSFTVLSAFIFGTFGLIFLMVYLNEKRAKVQSAEISESVRKSAVRRSHPKSFDLIISAFEWVEKDMPLRRVVVKLANNKILLENPNGVLLRAMEFNQNDSISLYYVSDESTLVIKSPHKYDMVLRFDSVYIRDQLESKLEEFVTKHKLKREKITKTPFKSIYIESQKVRQKKLEMFFRVVFAQAFRIQHSSKESFKVDSKLAQDVVHFQMTLQEFADSLQMSAYSEFVKKLFNLTDKDKNGFISYREFVDLIVICAKGDGHDKVSLLFKMYDIDNTGQISKEDFYCMIRFFLETCGGQIDEKELNDTIQSMLREARLSDKNKLTLEDFQKIIGKEVKTLNSSTIGFKGAAGIQFQKATQELESIYQDREDLIRFQGGNAIDRESNIIDETQKEVINKNETSAKPNFIIKYVQIKSREIFWLVLYTLVLLAIFAERAYYYSVEREHSGLRTIAGYGVTVTRGAASAMMFTYSSLLVTMCRNTITYLRSTMFSNYINFDAYISIHKYIAIWALIFSVIHIVGHAFNFYHISTQTADDLTCLFRNYFHATHEIPKFHYWCWQTMTGFTGILLTLVWTIMYVFTIPFVRQKIYNWFWYTHNLYPLFYILMILHGTGRLIQAPFTFYFLLGPLILFTLDTLVSISRKKIQIPVIKAEILPSDVTMLKFQKPHNFQYKAGEWVKIACLDINKFEYHPFTLSSCPKENYLTVHIRAVGPWTKLIRDVYQNALPENKLPKIYLDGPFGENHQDWYTYDISVLIGAGIGVTPFASILKDIAYGSENIRCKRVYFIWVSRTQKHFEWMLDIIREVELNDKRGLVSCHIFITQFFEKFDLRTTLVYICEKHYQRIHNKSMFTNLKAVTHFGRPNFISFFKTIENLHHTYQRFGVFSCGPATLTSAVDHACSTINSQGSITFEHHFNNF